MNKVKVVSAYVPLDVKHLSSEVYHEYGNRMFDALGRENVRFFDQQPLDRCWSYQLLKDLPPATETPADRYSSPQEHVKSHIVQHTRTQWAMRAMAEAVEPLDVVVWLDLAVMKQGQHTGLPVREDDLRLFLEKVQNIPLGNIPFPGITGPDQYNPLGNNWRFCGSTHIWPTKYLPFIDNSYRYHLRNFVRVHQKAPLDLAIWPLVEAHSGLPFRWYKAEYDRTQLTELPCASLSPALPASSGPTSPTQ